MLLIAIEGVVTGDTVISVFTLSPWPYSRTLAAKAPLPR